MFKKLILKPLFIERMQNLLSPADFGRYRKSLDEKPSVSFRCNTLKISPEELNKRLTNKGWKISQPWKNYPEVFIVEGKLVSKDEVYEIEKRLASKGIKINISFGDKMNNKFLIPLEPGELGRSLEHLLGYYYIQDLASMLPVIALEPKPNETILDMCASPGSKTTQISAKMENSGTLIANEVSLGRIKILASNTERCGCANTIITRKDGIALCGRMKKTGIKFDKILIDAPCSGEGTLRSSPKTSLMWNPHTIKSLSKLQKSMVESALQILKPNGIMVYSTCTHAPEENEEVLEFIINKYKNVKIESVTLPIKCHPGLDSWQNNKFSKDIAKSCRIYPHDTGTEGFFVSKIRKVKE